MTEHRSSSQPSATSFLELLGRIKPAIEQKLEALFRARANAYHDLGAEVGSIVDTSASLTLRGGKRYRAGMLAAAYFGTLSQNTAVRASELDEAVLAGGLALELLQSYLLIQDDWMDGDVERRGGPSAHVALARSLGSDAKGASAAILSSDLVWGLALEALAKAPAPPERLVKAIAYFSRMHEDVVIGQVLDSLAVHPDIEVVHKLKTGAYTVRGPVLLGAILAGASDDVIATLERYSEPLGVAFQLRDDLIGIFGNESEAGRPEASDLRSAKNTAVIREAKPRLDARGQALLDAVWGKPESDIAAIRAAVSAIEATGARAAVEARLFELCGQAESIARSLPFSDETRELLAGGASALRAVPKGTKDRA
jgi:geranylgeranyl diphosphate synthase, type I